MIDGGNEYVQNKGGPLRVHRSHSNLKNKTKRESHEEHETRNEVRNDRGRDSVAPRPHFLFFLSSLNSLNFWTL